MIPNPWTFAGLDQMTYAKLPYAEKRAILDLWYAAYPPEKIERPAPKENGFRPGSVTGPLWKARFKENAERFTIKTNFPNAIVG